MTHLRILLMVLLTMRLLMPPGICACKWTSPAARLLLSLAQSDRQLPNDSESDDDDHDPGCPASPLASGMGVKPYCEPIRPPALAYDALPLDSLTPLGYSPLRVSPIVAIVSPSLPLYESFRALLL